MLKDKGFLSMKFETLGLSPIRRGKITHTRGYPPAPILTGKTQVDWVWVFPDFKNGVGAGDGDIDTHPEPAPHISNYILSFLN
jgi:hypothetical protein